MTKKEMLGVMDAIFVEWTNQNLPKGNDINTFLKKTEFKFMNDKEIRWVKNRVRNSKYFTPTESYGDEERFILNDEGHMIMEFYGTYSNFVNTTIQSLQVNESVISTNLLQRKSIRLTIALAALTLLALVVQVWLQSQQTKLQQQSIGKQPQPAHYTTTNIHGVYFR